MILRRIVSSLVSAFALTVVIEAVAAFALGIRSLKSQTIVLLANLITNPLLNCALTAVSFYISPKAYYWFIFPLEAVAVITEGWIFSSVLRPKMNPFLLSLIVNTCSYFFGTMILYFVRH